ncbi:MAG: sigma-54 dependent transcriptional regulator [Myxococcota bacterium]
MHVLVVDDHPAVLEALQLLFVLHDFEVEVASSPSEALQVVQRGETGVVVQDMNFTASATTGEEGVELFRALRATDPDLPVILMTAWTDLQMAVDLVREGADDYLCKPWDDARLVVKVRRLLAARAVAGSPVQDVNLAGLVYRSPQMHGVVKLALRVARANVPVLVTGPSGAGKERVAALVQANSERHNRPFLRVNAGALPPELLEAELFGAEPGAYTGAQTLRQGRFEAANGGTLFLDEIATLTERGQAALLRVLQSGEYSRLGSSEVRRSDVRLITATNADLKAEMDAGRFRDDLYYRLAVIELEVPALVERPDDIELLAEHFLAEAGVNPSLLEGTARRLLREHAWPGNVRELQSAVQRAVLVREGERIGAADLGLTRTASSSDSQEAAQIRAALLAADGVVARAAEALGLSRQALYRRMDRLSIRIHRKVGR